MIYELQGFESDTPKYLLRRDRKALEEVLSYVARCQEIE